MIDLPQQQPIHAQEFEADMLSRLGVAERVLQKGKEMNNEVVWSFGFDEVAGFTVDRDLLDGDPRKIEYVDVTPDKGDNPQFKPGRLYSGRLIKPKDVPSKIEWSSKKYPPYDVFRLRGLIIVSDRFKSIIERYEPDVHQFFPIEVFYKDGSHARQMYFFNICNRLDTMDRKRATAKKMRVLWDPATGDYVFDKEVIGDRHAWKDKFLRPGRFLSDVVKTEIEEANLTGITFHSFPAH